MQKSPSKIEKKIAKVLIVDDEVFISEQLNSVLVELGYHVTEIAYNASSAIKSLMSNPPDIAILDIKMHGENQGFTIARYIRENMEIPFIFLTSFADESTVKEASNWSPDGYLLKPFNEKDVFSTLNIVLKRYEKKDRFFNLKIGYEVHKINVNHLLWIKASDKYIEIHTKNKSYLKRESIESFIDSNKLSVLIRIHRSYAVNLNNIDRVKGRKAFIGNQEIPISKTYHPALKNLLIF